MVWRKNSCERADFLDLQADRERFVKACRFQVFQIDRADNKSNVLVAHQVNLVVSNRAQLLGTATLKELEVVRIIDNPSGVCVFVVDADGN